jgi:hypothetical protein
MSNVSTTLVRAESAHKALDYAKLTEIAGSQAGEAIEFANTIYRYEKEIEGSLKSMAWVLLEMDEKLGEPMANKLLREVFGYSSDFNTRLRTLGYGYKALGEERSKNLSARAILMFSKLTDEEAEQVRMTIDAGTVPNSTDIKKIITARDQTPDNAALISLQTIVEEAHAEAKTLRSQLEQLQTTEKEAKATASQLLATQTSLNDQLTEQKQEIDALRSQVLANNKAGKADASEEQIRKLTSSLALTRSQLDDLKKSAESHQPPTLTPDLVRTLQKTATASISTVSSILDTLKSSSIGTSAVSELIAQMQALNSPSANGERNG